jgi:ATP-binding cassette subfamily F protein 3
MERTMSVLTAENLGLSFGAFDLFQGISVSIPDQAKIGLIGPNGIGKTSLLLVLTGLQPSTTGKVHVARGRRQGYLRQESMDAFSNGENTVFAEMLTVFSGLLTRQDRLHAMEEVMASGAYQGEQLDRLLAEYGDLQVSFEHDGGYTYDQRIRQTLQGLGLGEESWDTPLNHLSGGQKTRALLARLLLEQPDLLVLDEPTNHLDIQAVEWLERTLQNWEGAVLIVSHDRYFLDNTVGTIWEMGRSGIQSYSGNYSAYLLQRQERWIYAERVFAEEKARLLKEIDFVQRNWVRASTHGRALGVLKLISRDLATIENFGVMALRDGTKWSETGLHVNQPLDVTEAIRAIQALRMPDGRPPRIRPRIGTRHASGNVILRAQDLQAGYPGNVLFQVPELELRRGERVALIGPNGAGKTTFLKTLLGQLEPLGGELQLGASLKTGYFAQAQDALNPELSVLGELLRHKDMHLGQARSYLAQYLFQGEDVFKPVSVLSGGERSRLALAILALEGANFLLLDEPTNHLDIPAQEALEEMLVDFPGTILLVSHDRYLIDRLATQIWEVRDGRLLVFRGSYREYVLRQAGSPANGKKGQGILLSRSLVVNPDQKARKEAESLDRLEERIRQGELAVQRLASELQHVGQSGSFERVHQLSWQMAQAQAALEELLAEWEKLAIQ